MAESESLPRYHLLKLLSVFDPQPADAQRTYAELALRCRTRLWAGPVGEVHLPPGKPPGKPPPASGVTEAEEEAAMREAVGFFAPQSAEHLQASDTMVQRLAEVLDRICSRWTSGMEQPVGPSGATIVAP